MYLHDAHATGKRYRKKSWEKQYAFIRYESTKSIPLCCVLDCDWEVEPEVYEFECDWHKDNRNGNVYPYTDGHNDQFIHQGCEIINLIGKRTKVRIEVLNDYIHERVE